MSALALASGGSATTCQTRTIDDASTYQAQVIRFGAVTEYCLASPSRAANGIVLGSDGSVWFGENDLAGVAELFPNGTVAEYAFPGYPFAGVVNSTYPKTGIFSVTLWDGRVWAADSDGVLLDGLDPVNRSTVQIDVATAPHPPGSAAPIFPYLMTVAPDGSMWFTALPILVGKELPVVGVVSANLSVTAYSVQGLGEGEQPLQIQFYNSTLAYMVAFNTQNGYESGLYSFDPQVHNSTIVATQVGGGFALIYPDSLSISGDAVWIAEHGTSTAASYDLKTGVWTAYPTSTVSYEQVTLPYFVQAEGNEVWFNEHYANEIALLNPSTGTMTEYSEADPPVASYLDVQNDLTIAAAPGGLWFTSWTGNYIGFVSQEPTPSFSVSLPGGNQTTLSPGSSTKVTLQLSGTWSKTLDVLESDSENYTSVPSQMSIEPSVATVPKGSGPVSLEFTIGAKESLPPGRYTVDLTVSDGLLRQTAMVFVDVT